MNHKLLKSIFSAAMIHANSMTKPARGGSRPGAGRKTSDGAKELKRTNVMLDDSTIDRAIEIGEGNLSLGIRRAVKKLALRISPKRKKT